MGRFGTALWCIAAAVNWTAIFLQMRRGEDYQGLTLFFAVLATLVVLSPSMKERGK